MIAIPEARAIIAASKNGISFLFNQLAAAGTSVNAELMKTFIEHLFLSVVGGSCKPDTIVRAIKVNLFLMRETLKTSQLT